MTTTHTPGPWHIEPMTGDPNAIWIGNFDGYTAQITREDGLAPADWADARLIAAAPDLLAAAIDALETFERRFPDSPTAHDLRAAIARATKGD